MIDKLFERHYTWLLSCVLWNPEFARDVVHQAYLHVSNSTTPVEKIKNPKAYLRITVRNTMWDMLRRGRWQKLLNLNEELLQALEKQSMNSGFCQPDGCEWIVVEAWESLSELQKQILALSVGHGMSAREIAEAIGIKEDRVERELTAARKILQASISQLTQGRLRK